jgi:hypothetical protein
MREPSRPEGCLSDFAVDRWLAGELHGAEAAALEGHAAGCARCGRRVDEIRSERETFAREAPPLLLASRAPSAARRWMFAGSGAIAAAAGILLFLHAHDDSPLTRTKGGANELGFYVSHVGAVRVGVTGERVEPGDALRFVATSREPRYVAVLSLDGARHASVYYPSPSAATAAPSTLAVSGAAVPLPASTVLDDTLGDETIYGVFCPQPFDAEPLRSALEAAPDRAPAMHDCDVDTLRIRKEAPSSP